MYILDLFTQVIWLFVIVFAALAVSSACIWAYHTLRGIYLRIKLLYQLRKLNRLLHSFINLKLRNEK